MVPKALNETLPSASYPRPSMTFTEPSRKGPIRSVCVTLCFSPDGRMVHAGPLQTPSMKASGAIASRCAARRAAGSGRPWALAAAPPSLIRTAHNVAREERISTSMSGRLFGDDDGRAIGQHLGHSRRDFVGVVAHADHGVGAGFRRMLLHEPEGVRPRLLAQLGIKGDVAAEDRL